MGGMKVRGIRGATTVRENSPEAILQATEELLLAMVTKNQIAIEDIASIFFTTTKDLNRVFPAKAARNLGWDQVPLLDMQQLGAPDLPRTLRIMMHVNTRKGPGDIHHIYLGDASNLRPDLVSPSKELRR